ncbi:MAG: di-trans,poly-cis-decaprenylcistransferase [Lentisphaerae bacterium RIFOXYC12_FULL_60_16]|nr:MAG: di-trans,poly-cis-decaprenylcistransferase [Lentisphaerae bacterium RIFOXYC12_FULL_60_16]OGV72867.1 MAG: di-trans,poly-cis-decaprenylcistransferase [Lentisphaerae bacterium RIFOXYA12_FULL_60_10]OGV86260.1 MAG: di-trans,poly-cis-decaprenylcistransferase [Lentisphaerae bacterium RIFOXYB12_FULL_60_10]
MADNRVNPVPRHVAIIMDGNGRWAKERGSPRLKGHEAGAQSVRVVIKACRDAGVEFLTLYAFSVENWSRPKAEVDGLMRLLVRFMDDQEHELHENRVRLRVIGRLADLPDVVMNSLNRVMERTAGYTDHQLVLALSYGGRTEIAHAARRIAEQVKAGTLQPESVDEACVAANLYAPDIPYPDLLIRTSGEMRISNFLLWQLSYAELYVTPVCWPDFREPHFRAALDDYARRSRRFGGIEPEVKR